MVHGFSLLRRGAALGVLACLTAVGLAIPTTAGANGPTSLTSCQVINTAGTYRLDANVTTDAFICFDINASGVTLILNGHTITGHRILPNGELVGFGIYSESGATNANIVGPGTVTGWFDGINLQGGDGSVRGVTAKNNFEDIVTTSGSNSIQGNLATGGSSGIAILFLGGNNSIRGNDVTSTLEGIVVSSTGNTIQGNSAHGNSVFDLVDFTPNCDNVWKGNDFGTAFPASCIH